MRGRNLSAPQWWSPAPYHTEGVDVRATLDFGQFGFGQFDFCQLAEIELTSVLRVCSLVCFVSVFVCLLVGVRFLGVGFTWTVPRTAPPPDRPSAGSFFFLLCRPIFALFLSLRVSSWNSAAVQGRSPPKEGVWASWGHCVKPHPACRPPGLAQNDPERQKKSESGREREKEGDNLALHHSGPNPSGPHFFWASTLQAPTFSGLGPPSLVVSFVFSGVLGRYGGTGRN